MPHTADSNYVKFLEQRIKEAEQKEATLQTEITQLRLQGILEDSIRHAQQYAQIDSLRQITSGVPMTVDEDTLFYFYIARGGVTPQMRAQNARLALEKIGKKLVIKTDSVKIEKTDIVSDIMYGNQVLFSITDRDALWEKNKSRFFGTTAKTNRCGQVTGNERRIWPDPDTETHSLFHISRCRTMAVIPVYQLDLPQIAYPYRQSERYPPETGHAAEL